MSASVLIEAVEAEGRGGGGVVAPALGDVQVAGVFEGRDDGGADGPRGRSCRPGPVPLTGRGPAFCLLGGAPGMVAAHAGREWPAGAAAGTRAWPEQGPGQGARVEAVQHDPDR